MSQVLLHTSPGNPLPNCMLVQVPHPYPFTHPLPCDPHPLPNPDLRAQPGLGIPCASGTVLSENASHPLQNSSLPSASATPFQAPAVPNMTNPKEKTPMCLVNELARFNKIQPEYQLLSEEGPAHSKVFTVRLLLGEQCWEGEGTSIKKAQHAVATSALAQSNLPRPSLRSLQNTGRNPDSITPTVQLNARCMKLGKKPIYKTLDAYPNSRPNFNYGTRPPGPYPRYYYPFPPSGPVLCHIELSIGGQQFQGKGRTHHAARHDAAAKALEALQNEPLLDPQPEVCREQTERNLNKSEISQVFEIALKRNMPVSFEVQREAGPPHMKSFAVRVSVGEFSGEGEGKSKKAAKRNAAAAVLEELRRLPPAEKPQTHAKKQSKSIVKLQTSAEYGQGTNPISRLAQIQQAEKEKEPEYVLLSERGLPRRREFSMQVKVRDRCAEGMGPSKKVAKRNAADKMLELLGFKTQPQPPKPALKTEEKVQMKKPGEGRKVTFFEPSSEEESVSGPKEDEYRPHFQCRQQLPAGILPMVPELAQAVGASQSRPTKACLRASHDPRETTLSAMIANELLYAGTSCTAETIAKGNSVMPTPPLSRPSRPSEQLDYLASVQGLQVEYKDFPKNNKNEFVSLVNCSSQPPLISHGIGKDVESCHDMAALNILKLLSELEQLPNDRPGNRPSSAGGKREMAGNSLHKQAIHKVPEKNGHCV